MKQRVEENGFDSWLESSVPEILPDEIVKQVTPWKKAMGQVLAGFVMTSLSLDIFYLDIILPAVGYLFFFWGFSAVFRENRWFRAAKSRIATTCQRCTGFDAVVSGVLFAADVFWLFRIAASCCIVCGVCFCGAECRKNHEGIRGCRICYGYCTHKNP